MKKALPMFRFTIRDVLWLTVVVGMAVGWWLDNHHDNNRRQATLAHAERLRDTLAAGKRAYQIARDNYYRLNMEQGDGYYPLPPGPDWSIAEKRIPD
jgi:hypothetical protein